MLTTSDFLAMKRGGKKISMLTSYDAAFARMAEAAQIDMLLVGDSAANVLLGMNRTAEISMEIMQVLTAAVKRGTSNTYIVCDMPFGSDGDPKNAVRNAKLLINAGANAVKIEGTPLESMRAIKEIGIDIVGHLGLLPQTAIDFKQRGKSQEDAEKILGDAITIDELKPCAIVLEHIPAELGEKITKAANAPTIGIGAGNCTDGQVLVMHDILKMHPFKTPPFVQTFENFWERGVSAFAEYKKWVEEK
ncbi:3-methyl-2-oxobutanoate hydroxymethyltransferase [Fibrobacterales bacterium]|nr:3-methyl-2-oxobutanoate hydroxymethyltransferase [Fibrobacterales bacterium]